MSSGFSGKNGSKIALLSPEVYNRLSIPIFSIALLKPNPEETTPIDPIIEALLAIISSAAQASQYPPDAATSSTNANTGTLFLSDNSLIRFAIISDCTGDPPGELICKATAFRFLTEKACSIFLSISFKFKPFLLPIFGAITPFSGMTDTLLDFLKIEKKPIKTS